MQIDSLARNRVMAARIVAQNRWPYLSSLLFSLRLVEASHEELPTMAVDAGWRMYYSPVFVKEQEVDVLATALLHEAMHCVMQHNERYEALGAARGYHTLWNICGDAAINEILDDQNMPWGEFQPVRYEGFPVPGVLSGMITEGAYRIAVEWAQSQPNDADQLSSECGSSSGGESRGYELPPEDDTAPSTARERQASVRDRVASDVASHRADRGGVPGGLARWADSYLSPKVDWRKQLATRMRAVISNVAGRRNYSYQRPSRRQDAIRLHDPSIILPGLRDNEPPRIVVIVDTSGSVSNTELSQALSEVYGICKAVGMREPIGVIACDAKAQPVQYIRSTRDIAGLDLKGGGGTDLREGIQAALDQPRPPNLVIMVSDGESPFHPHSPSPNTEFLMVLTAPELTPPIPAWIKQIRVA